MQTLRFLSLEIQNYLLIVFVFCAFLNSYHLYFSSNLRCCEWYRKKCSSSTNNFWGEMPNEIIPVNTKNRIRSFLEKLNKGSQSELILFCFSLEPLLLNCNLYNYKANVVFGNSSYKNPETQSLVIKK